MNTKKIRVGLSIFLASLCFSCGKAGSVSEPVLSTNANTYPPPTATITTKPTKAPTFTPAPTLTSTNSSTQTSLPVPLNSAGPWLFLDNYGDVRLSNPDGTGLIYLKDVIQNVGWSKYAVAPAGGRLALFLVPSEPKDLASTPIDLTVIQFPSLAKLSIPLLTPPIAPQSGSTTEGQLNNIFAALIDENSVVWSPDGSRLAYAGVKKGGSSMDLFVYSTIDGASKQLTSGPTQTLHISWSPGGDYIVSAGAEAMYWGQGGPSPLIDGIWAVRPDGSGLQEVLEHPIQSPFPVGWANNHAYVSISGNIMCGLHGLTLVDVQNGSHYTLVPGPLQKLAFDPSSGTALVGIGEIADDNLRYKGCGPRMEPGFYLLSIFGDKPPQKLALEAPPADYGGPNYFVEWSPEAKRFFTASSAGLKSIDLKGQVAGLDISPQEFDVFWAWPVFMKSSPNGMEWAFFNQKGLWLASADAPIKQLYSGDVNDILWLADGSAFLFMDLNKLYRFTLGDPKPVQVADTLSRQEYPHWQLSWVMP